MKCSTSLIILLAYFFFPCACGDYPRKYDNWSFYNGSPEGVKYSSLAAIDTNNVVRLQTAWTYHTGDADTASHSQIQCNPIIIDSTLYGTSPQMKLFALDAKTGREKWVFDPFQTIHDTGSRKSFFIMNNCRGVAYWSDGNNDKRLFYTAGSFLHCIDASTGKYILSFGNQGRIDLHDGLGRDVKDLLVTATSPGMVYKNLLIMGTRVDERAAAAPGHIRAYDVQTGKMIWIFHTIPQPGEEGYDTWEDKEAWKHIGGANTWSGFSLDVTRGLIFCPTGSASFDFYGGKRKGSGLFGDCLLAIHADNGKLAWHFQDIHHDVWDRDLPTPPALLSITKDGKKMDVVAQTTKTGFVFVLDRDTGKPVFGVEEKKVPVETALTGEKIWPSQPFPVLPGPFVRQRFTSDEINPYLPDSALKDIQQRLASYKHEEMYDPPSREGTVILPGYDGGGEYGGPAADPETGILYINANEMAWVLTMVDANNEAARNENFEAAGKRLYQVNCMTCHGAARKGSGNYPSLLGIQKKYNEAQFMDLVNEGRRMMPSFKQLGNEEKNALASFILNIKSKQKQPFIRSASTEDAYWKLPYTNTGYNKFLSKDGLPAIRPPWGSLTAINLNTGAFEWQIPLGEDERFKGKHTGTENYGGPVVTAGGLLFIAATKDGMFRAFNKRNGKLLWETALPAPAYATPAVFALNGKQYIVIACGGGKLNTRSGDAYIAFCLPGKKG